MTEFFVAGYLQFGDVHIFGDKGISSDLQPWKLHYENGESDREIDRISMLKRCVYRFNVYVFQGVEGAASAAHVLSLPADSFGNNVSVNKQPFQMFRFLC
jgi:hypothetical protein